MTVALFHPTFETVGGAELLVATQAQYLRKAGVDVVVVTLGWDPARWQSLLHGIPLRVATRAPWYERVLLPYVKELQHTVPRTDAMLRDCTAVLACNYPTNVLLGASGTAARKLWCCTEPSRYVHVVGANPHLYARVTEVPGGQTEVERYFSRRLRARRSPLKRAADAALVAYDIAQTRKLETIYAISDFSRGVVRRVYARTDAQVIYPIVRFPAEVPHRSGLRRAGLQILAHSRLELLKNIENVARGFALFKAKQQRARLHIVGEGPARRSLERLAERLEIRDAVTFHGYLPQDRLAAVYEQCDVFALQPLDEPFGMVFPEAAARGLLLVGPDHGGPLEIMDGGRLGFPCDPFSPEAVSDAFSAIDALPDGEVDARRARAADACRSRYSEATIGPQLRRALAPA